MIVLSVSKLNDREGDAWLRSEPRRVVGGCEHR
jgi:hypothetical protein